MALAQIPPVARRTTRLVPTAVNAILAELREQLAHGRDVISLMRGEPDFPTPPHIVEAATEALRAGRTRYPDNRGERRLRDAVATKLQRDNGVSYDPASEILITTGATLGLQIAFLSLLNDGDEVLLPDPVYDAYSSPVLMAGSRVRPVRAALDQGRFVLPLSAVETAIGPASRLLLLNTPWNPTGTVLREQEIRALGDLVIARDLVLVSDEIYEALTYGDVRHVSPAAVSPGLRDRTVLVNSLSKTYAMTGWRVGYCAGPAHVIDAMFLALQQVSRGPATFVQDAAAAALDGPQEAVAQMREEYTRRRAQVAAALGDLSNVEVVLPDGGFFAMVDITRLGRSSNEVRRRLLQDFDVAVVHGAAYGPGGEGMLRVSFGSGGDLLSRGLDRLRAGLRALA